MKSIYAIDNDDIVNPKEMRIYHYLKRYTSKETNLEKIKLKRKEKQSKQLRLYKSKVNSKFNFKIGEDFHQYGWASISINNGKKNIIEISASGVFNPFYELKYGLDNFISKNKSFRWTIDQEGFDAVIDFKPSGKNIIITTKTLKDSLKNIPAKTNVFTKKEVVNEISRSLIQFGEISSFDY